MHLAALRGQRLWRVPVSPEGVVGEPQAHFEGQLGRIRDVTLAPDGSLLLVTDDAQDGRLLRVPLA